MAPGGALRGRGAAKPICARTSTRAGREWRSRMHLGRGCCHGMHTVHSTTAGDLMAAYKAADMNGSVHGCNASKGRAKGDRSLPLCGGAAGAGWTRRPTDSFCPCRGGVGSAPLRRWQRRRRGLRQQGRWRVRAAPQELRQRHGRGRPAAHALGAAGRAPLGLPLGRLARVTAGRLRSRRCARRRRRRRRYILPCRAGGRRTRAANNESLSRPPPGRTALRLQSPGRGVSDSGLGRPLARSSAVHFGARRPQWADRRR